MVIRISYRRTKVTLDNLLPTYSKKGTEPSFCARYGGLKLYLYSNRLCGPVAVPCWSVTVSQDKAVTSNKFRVLSGLILHCWSARSRLMTDDQVSSATVVENTPEIILD